MLLKYCIAMLTGIIWGKKYWPCYNNYNIHNKYCYDNNLQQTGTIQFCQVASSTVQSASELAYFPTPITQHAGQANQNSQDFDRSCRTNHIVITITMHNIMLKDTYCGLECWYHSVPGKRPLPGKRPCTSFQGVNVAASIQTHGSYVPGKHPWGPKSRVMFKRPWALTWDTMVIVISYLLGWEMSVPPVLMIDHTTHSTFDLRNYYWVGGDLITLFQLSVLTGRKECREVTREIWG